jgi:cysteine desulfurase
MLPHLRDGWGNPSSAYKLGQQARKALEAARERVAALLGAKPDEIVFTSGGSESDSLAIQGGAEFARQTSGGRRRRIITSAIEHEAVLDSFRCLHERGFDVVHLPVDADCRVSPAYLAKFLTDETALVSVMLANNEIGTIQPVKELAAMCRAKHVLFHTDAVQAAGKVPLDVKTLGADLLSISGHKLNAPKGIGALYIRGGVQLVPLITGKHEKKRRGGTENVAGAAALGRACELAMAELATHAAELSLLRSKLEAGVLKLEGVRLNGAGAERLPNTSHFSFKELDGHSLLVALDLEGICVSTGSACSTGQSEPSHVLKAMGINGDEWPGALRVSLGWGSGEKDVLRFLEVLPKAVEKLRAAHRALQI